MSAVLTSAAPLRVPSRAQRVGCSQDAGSGGARLRKDLSRFRKALQVSAVLTSATPLRVPSRARRLPGSQDASSSSSKGVLPPRADIHSIPMRSWFALIAARGRRQWHTLGPARRALRRCMRKNIENPCLCKSDQAIREPRPTRFTPRSPPPAASGALAATARNATLPRRRC